MIRRVHAAASLAAILVGCSRPVNDMVDQPRKEPYEASQLFADGGASRLLPAGVVPRDGATDAAGGAPLRPALAPGVQAADAPDMETLERGRERYQVFCAPCHGLDGSGEGIVVQRGHPRPPSLHSSRLRRVDDAHIERVIASGLGKMPPYGAQVPAEERPALVAYVRALQLSQHAPLSAVPEDARARLSSGPAERPIADEHQAQQAGVEAGDDPEPGRGGQRHQRRRHGAGHGAGRPHEPPQEHGAVHRGGHERSLPARADEPGRAAHEVGAAAGRRSPEPRSTPSDEPRRQRTWEQQRHGHLRWSREPDDRAAERPSDEVTLPAGAPRVERVTTILPDGTRVTTTTETTTRIDPSGRRTVTTKTETTIEPPSPPEEAEHDQPGACLPRAGADPRAVVAGPPFGPSRRRATGTTAPVARMGASATGSRSTRGST